jgi:hypothetical protein
VACPESARTRGYAYSKYDHKYYLYSPTRCADSERLTRPLIQGHLSQTDVVRTPLSAAPDAAARLRPRLPTLHTKLDANHGHDSVAPPESRGALAAWDCYHGSA